MSSRPAICFSTAIFVLFSSFARCAVAEILLHEESITSINLDLSFAEIFAGADSSYRVKRPVAIAVRDQTIVFYVKLKSLLIGLRIANSYGWNIFIEKCERNIPF